MVVQCSNGEKMVGAEMKKAQVEHENAASSAVQVVKMAQKSIAAAAGTSPCGIIDDEFDVHVLQVRLLFRLLVAQPMPSKMVMVA